MKKWLLGWIFKKVIGFAMPFKWFKIAVFIYKLSNYFIMNKGALSNKDERWLARFLDNLKKFDNPIVEMADYYVYRGLIKICDDVIYERFVPDNWKNPILELIELAKANDVDGIGEIVISRVNEKIDLPFMDEPTEEIMFRNAYGLLAAKLYKGLLFMKEKGQQNINDAQD